MKTGKARLMAGFLLFFLIALPARAEEDKPDFPVKKVEETPKTFTILGYYLVRTEYNNIAPEDVLFNGQIVGRLFGDNTTSTSKNYSFYSEQRFMPMITWQPRILGRFAKMRMSFELDWTWGDQNYGAGGNFGGAFGADQVNLQTQNVFAEISPNKTLYFNIGLLRFYDNTRVPYYTPTNELVYKGYRLAVFGSDATGFNMHWFFRPGQTLKLGVYELYENQINATDDVQLAEVAYERDLDIVNTIGLNLFYVRDYSGGRGGISIFGQGLNSRLADYNGVVRLDLGKSGYKADLLWLGTNFHGNPLLTQGRFGYTGFLISDLGYINGSIREDGSNANVDVFGYASNLRLAYKYGRTANDYVALDLIHTSGDDNNSYDGKYNGFLTGNNWTSPGAVFFSHGLYLLLPHGTVVNRYVGAVMDIQFMGYGFTGGSLIADYDIIPNKFRVKGGLGAGRATRVPKNFGSYIGTEVNLNVCYTLKVYLDLELHAAYLKLGGFYDNPEVNGGKARRPDDPWTTFATLKWILF